MYTIGLDIGSTSSKAVILKTGRQVVAQAAIASGTGTKGPEKVLEKVLFQAGLREEDIRRTVVTGYGRKIYSKADKQVSELSCHAKGVYFLLPDARTVIDIGGQDAKAMNINDKGHMTNFVMNEKCAAGTGRFLDVMARVLDVELCELADLSALSKKKVSISSVCTVFAESEVISHLASGESVEDVCAGIHASVAQKVTSLARRVEIKKTVVLTGGVAQNQGVVKAMEEILELKLSVPQYPQLTGALGAALYACEL